MVVVVAVAVAGAVLLLQIFGANKYASQINPSHAKPNSTLCTNCRSSLSVCIVQFYIPSFCCLY
jgi:hypothetical protein